MKIEYVHYENSRFQLEDIEKGLVVREKFIVGTELFGLVKIMEKPVHNLFQVVSIDNPLKTDSFILQQIVKANTLPKE
jgi:hypothetical protein